MFELAIFSLEINRQKVTEQKRCKVNQSTSVKLQTKNDRNSKKMSQRSNSENWHITIRHQGTSIKPVGGRIRIGGVGMVGTGVDGVGSGIGHPANETWD